MIAFLRTQSISKRSQIDQVCYKMKSTLGSLFASCYDIVEWTAESGRFWFWSQTGRTCLSACKLSQDPKSDTKLFNCLVEDCNHLSLINSTVSLLFKKTVLKERKKPWNVSIPECKNEPSVWSLANFYSQCPRTQDLFNIFVKVSLKMTCNVGMI
jgi:hypothetical protein